MNNRIVSSPAQTIHLDRASDNPADTIAATQSTPRPRASDWLHGLRSLGNRLCESNQSAALGSTGSNRKTSDLPIPLRQALDRVTASKQRKAALSLTDTQLELALSDTTLTGRATRAVQRENKKRQIERTLAPATGLGNTQRSNLNEDASNTLSRLSPAATTLNESGVKGRNTGAARPSDAIVQNHVHPNVFGQMKRFVGKAGVSSGSQRHVSSSVTARAAKLSGPPSSPRLTTREQGLVGAARWPDIYDQSHTEQNQEYCRSMYRASSAAASSIANGGLRSFEEIWNTATEWRLARVGNDAPGRDAFATERSAGSVFNTKLDMQYASIIPRILNHQQAKKRTYDGPFLTGIRCKVYQQTGDIDGRSIPLTSLWTTSDKRELAQKMMQLYEQHDDFEEIEDSLNRHHPNNIIHTDTQYLPRIKQHLESLFAQATRRPLGPRDALRSIARIHWWAASAAPDMRGSAAKAEFVARAVAGAQGIELPPFKQGVVPDIEAMLCSESEFVARYSSLFERHPI